MSIQPDLRARFLDQTFGQGVIGNRMADFLRKQPALSMFTVEALYSIGRDAARAIFEDGTPTTEWIDSPSVDAIVFSRINGSFMKNVGLSLLSDLARVKLAGLCALAITEENE
jgi:hypothetical protein